MAIIVINQVLLSSLGALYMCDQEGHASVVIAHIKVFFLNHNFNFNYMLSRKV
jgi:hypothetical protein